MYSTFLACRGPHQNILMVDRDSRSNKAHRLICLSGAATRADPAFNDDSDEAGSYGLGLATLPRQTFIGVRHVRESPPPPTGGGRTQVRSVH
jgi:hypothetical protein